MVKKREFFYSALPWSSLTQITEDRMQIPTLAVEESEGRVQMPVCEDLVDPNVESSPQLAAGYGGESYDNVDRPLTLGDIMAMDSGGQDVSMKKKNKVKPKKKSSSPKDSGEEEKENGSCKWTEKAFAYLVDAKMQELQRLMDKNDAKFHMLRAESKWKYISEYMAQFGQKYNWKQCRDKWGAEMTLYKRLSDYQGFSGRQDYFAMEPEERKQVGLPADYSAEHFELMSKVLKDRDNINPPGVRDSGKVKRQVRKAQTSTSDHFTGTEDGTNNSSENMLDYSSEDEYTAKKKKRKRIQKEPKKNSKDQNMLELESVLENYSKSSGEQLSGIFKIAMKEAAEDQRESMKILVEAGHQDVKTLADLLQQMIPKQ